MEADFEIIHRTGVKHQTSYTLSSFLANGSDRAILEDYIPAMAVPRSNKQALIFLGIYTRDRSHAELDSISGDGPSKLLGFIEAQRANTYCNQLLKYMCLPNTTFTYD